MVYVHIVSVRPIFPSGITNLFPIDPLKRPTCQSFWFLWDLEVINPHGRLLYLLGQVGDGCGEVSGGLSLGHQRVPVCCRRFCQVNGGIVGVLPSFSEVFYAVVSRQPGGYFLFLLASALCRLEVCLKVCPGFVGTLLIVPLVTVIVK